MRRGGLAGAALLALVLLVGCAETRRPLGEDCLKNGDCLSGVCTGLRCASAPPLLDGSGPEIPFDAAVDAGDASDATVDDAAGDGAASG